MSREKGTPKYASVVIVGFGYINSKYYWLIQNSLGSDFCDNGFLKIEFGEIGIENIVFSQPYIQNESGRGDTIILGHPLSPKNVE